MRFSFKAPLSDVAPYSREYNTFRQKVASQAQYDTGLQIELDKIIDRVRQTKESSIRMSERRFTLPTDEIEGTVDAVSPAGIKLREYPGWGENNQVFPSCRDQKPSRTRAAAISRVSGAIQG